MTKITKKTIKYDATNVPTVDPDTLNQSCNNVSKCGDTKRAVIAATTQDIVAIVSYIPPRIVAQIVETITTKT